MNLKLIKFLGAICIGLFALIVGEWLYAVYAQNQLIASIEQGDKKQRTPERLPVVELTQRPESSYVDMVARPLFIPGRKPVNETTEDTKPAAAAASDSFNWSLNGVYTHKGRFYALFTRTNTKIARDNYRKITKNEEIDGWKLVDIALDKVIVTQGEKRKELPLRKPKPKNIINNTGRSTIAPNQNPNQNPNQLMPPPGEGIPPSQQPPVPIPPPVEEQPPIPEPDPIIEEDPGLEPELIPDEASEPYFENPENEQFQ
jgi:hypothetical protein